MTAIDGRLGYNTVPGGDIIIADDMLNDHTSLVVDLRGSSGKVSVHLKVGTNADAAGALKVRVSNFPETDDGVDLVLLDGSSQVDVVAGTTLSEVLDIETYARFLWVFWDFSSGTGTNQLDVNVEVKKRGS